MSDKQGMAIIFVGATNHGKTKFGVMPLLDELPNMPKLIFDLSPSQEYQAKYNCNFKVNKDGDLDAQRDTFCKEAQKRDYHIIVFEDATAFFSNKGTNKAMNNLLVFKAHRNQIIILVFHSLRSIPVEIMDNVNYINMRKTGDRPSLIEGRYDDWPEVYETYLDVDKNPDMYYSQEAIINLP